MMEKIKKKITNIDLKKDWAQLAIIALALMMYFNYSYEPLNMGIQHLLVLGLSIYAFLMN